MTPYRLNDRVAKILADDQKTDVDSGHMAVAGVILAELEKAYASRHRADLSADLVRAGYLAGIGAAQSEGFSAPVSPDYIAAIVARVTEGK